MSGECLKTNGEEYQAKLALGQTLFDVYDIGGDLPAGEYEGVGSCSYPGCEATCVARLVLERTRHSRANLRLPTKGVEFSSSGNCQERADVQRDNL